MLISSQRKLLRSKAVMLSVTETRNKTLGGKAGGRQLHYGMQRVVHHGKIGRRMAAMGHQRSFGRSVSTSAFSPNIDRSADLAQGRRCAKSVAGRYVTVQCSAAASAQAAPPCNLAPSVSCENRQTARPIAHPKMPPMGSTTNVAVINFKNAFRHASIRSLPDQRLKNL